MAPHDSGHDRFARCEPVLNEWSEDGGVVVRITPHERLVSIALLRSWWCGLRHNGFLKQIFCSRRRSGFTTLVRPHLGAQMLAREVSSYLTEAVAGAKTPPPLRRTVCDPNHRVMADSLQPCERSFSAGGHDRQETHLANS